MALILHRATAEDPRLAALQGHGLPVRRDGGSGDRLLLDPRARPDQAWCDALAELRAAHPGALLLGRAWAADADPAQLDPPDQPAWLLLPEALLSGRAPQGPELPADPAGALAVLLPLAARHALLLLEATDVAPLRRCGAAAAGNGREAGWRPHPPDARRLGRALPEAPVLELLLLAPAARLPALQAALQPAPSLPWQVRALPLAADDDPLRLLQRALPQTRAEWLGLLVPGPAEALPPPALLAAALRRLRRADLDGLDLAPHGLVLRRSWWLDACPAGPPTQLARQLRQRGAQLGTLSLQAPPSPAVMADPDPLWAALLAELDRAEALLLAQQQRIHSLEQERRRLQARLNPPASADDPADG